MLHKKKSQIKSKLLKRFFSIISSQKYYILLMITNGLISDYEFTYFKIKELSVLPLSIIIVGIGDGQGKSKEGKDMDYFSELQKYFSCKPFKF